MTIDIDNFKALVSAFQAHGDRTIIDKILDYMYIRYDLTGIDDLPEYAMYIAFRINVILSPLLKTAKYNVDPGSYDPEDLWWYAKGIREELGIEISPANDWKDVHENIPAIERVFGEGVRRAILYAIHKYREQEAAIDLEIERIVREIEPTLIVPSLEVALSKVDTARSEREMVRFINQTFQTEYTKRQAAEKGTRRLGRRDKDGNFVNVYVQPKPTPIWNVLLGVDVSQINVTEVVSGLTDTQRETILQLHELVFDDFERKDFGSYKVNESGQYEIINRRMAERLGMDESTLRKRRQSIKRALIRTAQ